jgi:hypothetical protein
MNNNSLILQKLSTLRTIEIQVQQRLQSPMCIVHFYQQGLKKLDNSTKTQKVQQRQKKKQKFG